MSMLPLLLVLRFRTANFVRYYSIVNEVLEFLNFLLFNRLRFLKPSRLFAYFRLFNLLFVKVLVADELNNAKAVGEERWIFFHGTGIF